jgi:hypothetical protein
MTKKEHDWKEISPLLSDFLKRHRISPVKVEAAQVVGEMKSLLDEHFPHAKRHFEVKQFREPEIVVCAHDPFLAQQLRLQGTQLVQKLQKVLPGIKVSRVRVVGR